MQITPEWRRRLTHAYFTRLAKSSAPILVGPWRSEVGFEALYWLPFLRAFAQQHHIKSERLIAVTRGGASVLYGTPSIDLYRLRSVDAVRLENNYDWQRTQLQKQTRRTAWDRDVLKEAAAVVLGRGQRYQVLHPSWMYWALEPWWADQRGLPYLQSLTDYSVLPKLPRAQTLLPAHYVAMKWYDRATFPIGDPHVQATIRTIVETVTQTSPVVLLQSHLQTDEHIDLIINHPRVHTLPVVPSDQQLGQQLQVLSHADAFVGTYGGLAQTALRMGVPSASFWQAFGGTAHAHLTLSDMLSKQTQVPFLSGSLQDIDAWRRILGPLVVRVPAPESATQTSATALVEG